MRYILNMCLSKKYVCMYIRVDIIFETYVFWDKIELRKLFEKQFWKILKNFEKQNICYINYKSLLYLIIYFIN